MIDMIFRKLLSVVVYKMVNKCAADLSPLKEENILLLNVPSLVGPIFMKATMEQERDEERIP